MVLWVSTAHDGYLKTSVFRREGVIPSILCAKSDNGRVSLQKVPFAQPVLLMGNLWIGCDGCNQCFNLKSTNIN